uniref:PDZ domain-containing protein n=1 Tax=Eucampia antarctica TaxID=49252 RepID=A0A7S2S9V6_9STRA|mmetsp:Transcript_5222/g.4895  ORF Transcript_5222/g.4895 Transcript_5222/m.4895 type:complete len:248 (+) Transcript_5222:64-807(+)|eukprot:CAMPEP_0197825988 /NCGR_PEP_ID=MMETSP1437-20131217/3008_1 /TAXON_ID=49252 ORGANISM="Eucampia antarctica, Strain CCMP1452" /NCGR_SAMPLE_ID=MMETSP1437 /ASSEMBLY_ACC=CAM_ASM_001096 /LENGTH=247 /DNA_ID=CAMNT_0043426223 /DNA_START=63 /DNA_END=806 /DNA_ORIENTATION=-
MTVSTGNASFGKLAIFLVQVVGLLVSQNSVTSGFVVKGPSSSSSYYNSQHRVGGEDTSKSSSSSIIGRSRVVCESLSVPGMWTRGNGFGKGTFKFYTSFEGWMKPFGDEDREAFPEVFQLPEGVYEVSTVKPLGIVFEEIEDGGKSGVYVVDVVEGGNAQFQGKVQKGDLLIALTAIKVSGAKWERRLIPAVTFDFDTVVGAIGSNDVKWGCSDVILQFARPGQFDQPKVDAFLEFFEPPSDTPWKL